MRRWVVALYALVVVAYVGVALWSLGQLPEQVVSHFDAAGAGDGSTSRGVYVATTLAVGALILLGLPALGWVCTAGSGTFVNVPHKDYWLAPQRRAAFRRRFLDDMLLFAAMTGAFLTVMEVAMVAANRRTPPAMGAESWIALGAFLVITALWCVDLTIRRYAPPPDRST
ncbi:DUF1648 domain-containing protein [Agilicoccus flavus]|uniref:DUF1648 domain-containing protein n=1 Tax=Agilicoccus flavus TaxID=2775968 RepID=UPI001CF631C2|nr:DUF1648 domain-containing protein [Agilicoccus flavus]